MKKILSFILCFLLLSPVNIIYAVDANWVAKSAAVGQSVEKSKLAKMEKPANDISQQSTMANMLSTGLQSFQEQGPITIHNKTSIGVQAPPAWAQSPLLMLSSKALYPFASNLFEGNFSSAYSFSINQDYKIQVGDRIEVLIWGATNFSSVLIVDIQGNIFIPEVGPINVLGCSQSKLSSVIKSKVSSVYTNNVDLYVNLQTALPMSIFVTGFVVRPGKYAGNSHDSVLSFIDRAGGIDAERGSYRKISVLRNRKVIANVDLYDFALYGDLPNVKLKEGDVILIREKNIGIAAIGSIRDEAVYELTGKSKGSNLIDYCAPYPGVSHVGISGVRYNEPINKYLTINEFKNEILQDGDIVEFISSKPSQTIMVSVQGATSGKNRFPVKRGTTLKRLLPYIEVDPKIASVNSIYILRQSVAIQQKAILEDSLNRLEQSALTATSSTTTEASIRVQEAQLIQNFVQRASTIEPDGVVVVAHNGKLSDLILEDHDVIVVPQLSDVVHISGEVMIPKAVAWTDKMELKDFVNVAGGYSQRADKSNILTVRMNGEVGKVKEMGIKPGDRILVLPRFDSKNIDLISSITQILYQIAIATSVVVDITDNK